MDPLERANDPFPDWPNCVTPDCGNKACDWAPLPTLCFPCGERRLGRAAMIAAFHATHDGSWDDAQADA